MPFFRSQIRAALEMKDTECIEWIITGGWVMSRLMLAVGVGRECRVW